MIKFTNNYKDLQDIIDNVYKNIGNTEIDKIKQTDYNIYEQEGYTFIECLVPGYDKSQIRIDLFQDRIDVSTEKLNKKYKDAKFTTKMLDFGHKNFTFKLVPELLSGEITSSLENGILTIKIKPKNTTFQQHIEIN